MAVKNKKAWMTLSGILLLVVGAILYWQVFRAADRSSKPPGQPTLPEYSKEMDIAALDNESANQYQVFAALVRLAQMRDPTALKEAIKRAQDKSEWVRAGCAEALGYYEDAKAQNLLFQLLKDQSQMVRVKALKGLGLRRDEKNKAYLQRVLTDAKLSFPEFVEASASFVKIAQQPQEKIPVLEKLVQRSVLEADLNNRFNGLTSAAGLGPTEEFLIKALNAELTKNEAPRIMEMSIRHLAAVQPNEMRERVLNLKNHPESGVRLAVVQTLHLVCPSERWAILGEILMNEKDSLVWNDAVREIVLMPAPEGKRILEQLMKNDSLSGEQKKTISTAQRQLAATKARDFCEGKQGVVHSF